MQIEAFHIVPLRLDVNLLLNEQIFFKYFLNSDSRIVHVPTCNSSNSKNTILLQLMNTAYPNSAVYKRKAYHALQTSRFITITFIFLNTTFVHVKFFTKILRYLPSPENLDGGICLPSSSYTCTKETQAFHAFVNILPNLKNLLLHIIQNAIFVNCTEEIQEIPFSKTINFSKIPIT